MIERIGDLCYSGGGIYMYIYIFKSIDSNCAIEYFELFDRIAWRAYNEALRRSRNRGAKPIRN